MRPNVHRPGLCYCIRVNLISNFYIDNSLWTLKILSPKLHKPRNLISNKNDRVTREKILYVEMPGQHPCSWTNTWTLREVAKAWRTMVAAPTWILAFLWTHGMTLGMRASSCMAGCCFGGTEPSDPYTDLGAWASLNQCGSGRSHRPATVAWSFVWPGRQEQPAESSVWPVMLLVIPELNKVGSGLSLFFWSHREECNMPMAKFWARFHGAGIIFTKCCAVPGRMELLSQMGL